MIQFVESRVVKLQALIADIAMHYNIDFVKNDGFHFNKVDETLEKVHEVLGYIFLVVECYQMELTTLKGKFVFLPFTHRGYSSILLPHSVCTKRIAPSPFQQYFPHDHC